MYRNYVYCAHTVGWRNASGFPLELEAPLSAFSGRTLSMTAPCFSKAYPILISPTNWLYDPSLNKQISVASTSLWFDSQYPTGCIIHQFDGVIVVACAKFNNLSSILVLMRSELTCFFHRRREMRLHVNHPQSFQSRSILPGLFIKRLIHREEFGGFMSDKDDDR